MESKFHSIVRPRVTKHVSEKEEAEKLDRRRSDFVDSAAPIELIPGTRNVQPEFNPLISKERGRPYAIMREKEEPGKENGTSAREAAERFLKEHRAAVEKEIAKKRERERLIKERAAVRMAKDRLKKELEEKERENEEKHQKMQKKYLSSLVGVKKTITAPSHISGATDSCPPHLSFGTQMHDVADDEEVPRETAPTPVVHPTAGKVSRRKSEHTKRAQPVPPPLPLEPPVKIPPHVLRYEAQSHRVRGAFSRRSGRDLSSSSSLDGELIAPSTGSIGDYHIDVADLHHQQPADISGEGESLPTIVCSRVPISLTRDSAHGDDDFDAFGLDGRLDFSNGESIHAEQVVGDETTIAEDVASFMRTKKKTEYERYCIAMRSQLCDQMERDHIELPGLCFCQPIVSLRDGAKHHSNCFYYANPHLFVQDIERLLRSMDIIQ